VLRHLGGVVTRGRVILQGISVLQGSQCARGSVSCGIKLRCFSGVVLEDLDAEIGRCVSCKEGGGVAVWFAPYQVDIGTPVVDPAINDTTPNRSTTP
jgi:hypothetical protein